MRGSRPKSKTLKVALATLVLAVVLIAVLAHYIFMPRRHRSPSEELAKEFYHIDEQGLHWDYQTLSSAYNEFKRESQILDLLVKSRAAHLIPQIINSMGPDSGRYTQRKLDAIIVLTGHDLSKELDIHEIWDKKDTERTKALLHKWWTENSEHVLRSRGPKDKFDPPNHWPSLTLDLKTEKAKYLQLEPIRLTTILNNSGNTWYTFAYKLRKPAFTIEYFKVLDDGNSVSIARTAHARNIMICGNVRRWFTKPRFLMIDAGSFHVSQRWLHYNDQNSIGPGKVTLRAVLKPLRGEHKGKQLRSTDLTINIVEPQGPDAAAYKFITGRQPVDLGPGSKFPPDWIVAGLCPQWSSIHGHPMYEYFVTKYAQSSYANYVRYTLATRARYPDRPDAFRKHMTDMVDIAPRDFPLLADTYANLLEHYKETGELDKMSALCKTIRAEHLTIADPRLSERLSKLTQHVDTVVSRIHLKGRFGRTLLHSAAKEGSAQLVRFLISKGANVDERDSVGQTPLYLAAAAGHKEIAEILIDNGANVNIQDTARRAILCLPIQNNHKEIVELLIAKGAEVNVTDSRGRTPAHWAANRQRAEILRLLANTTGKHGWTPLHWAARHGKKAMAELLLSNGARVDIKDDKGQTPLDIAIKYLDDDHRRIYIVELLREYEGRKATQSQD